MVQDANFNVTAVVDDSGEVVERYVYDPFGQVTVLHFERGIRGGAESGSAECGDELRSDDPSATVDSGGGPRPLAIRDN